jgi:glycosyltransferase involved in cell wall biosynthesis
MVATGVARTTGYSVRVWFALRAVRAAQGEDADSPTLVSFESFRDWVHPSIHRRIAAQARYVGARAVCLPTAPRRIPGSIWLNAWWCTAAVWVLVALLRPRVVHAQSHFAAGACARALRRVPAVQLVFDAHGVDVEERLADGRMRPGSREHRFRMRLEGEAVRRADWLLPVSSNLAARLLDGTRRVPATFQTVNGYLDGRDAACRVRVVPCVSSLAIAGDDIESLRSRARQQLGLATSPVVLYLGGSSRWQQPQLVVDCFRAARPKAPDAVLLVVTNNRDDFAELLRASGLPEDAFRILSVAHDEVADWAVAADVGLLLRVDDLVSRVASPTKFAEYLALGVPVLLTDALSDFAALVDEQRIGRVVPSRAPVSEMAEALLDLMRISRAEGIAVRGRCRAAAEECLSFEAALATYREIYVWA